MATIRKNYRCSQAALYALTRLAWANYSANLARFTAFKPLYTAPFGTARVAEITAAEDLPGEQVRDEVSESSNLRLTQKAEICLDAWRFLERYIITAFPEPFTKPKLEAAGSDSYTQAADFNWEVLQSMLNDAENFITANLAALTAGNNMPAAFPATFTAAKTAFDSELSVFLLAEANQSLATDAKIFANNNLQTKVMSMLLDGQTIFQNELSTRELFIYDNLLGIITNSIADLKGTVTTGIADTPLSDATITIVQLDRSTQSDADGRYDFGSVSAGTYTVTISKPGFITQTIPNVEIAIATTVTLNFSLVSQTLSAIFTLIHQSPAASAALQIKGTAGDILSIAWGEAGSDESFTLTGNTDNITHQYTAPGIYTIEVKGNHPERIIEMLVTNGSLTNAQLADNLTALEVLNLEYNPFVSFIMPIGLIALNYVSFFQGALNVTSINSILQIINALGTSGGTLLMHGGTNAAPTGQGITAKNELESRGWTVATN